MEKIYSVSEFNRMVKSYIDDIDDFQDFYIEGEISNITYYKSGHLYFSVKDSKSQIKCAAFNYKMKRIPEDLKEGDAIKLFGDVGFYEVKGEFQVLVRHIEKQNALGALFAKLEKVKEKMAEKGYFDESHKKELPRFPKNIGVVTALTGAALQDIIKTTRKRFNSINIYVYPAKVQGLGAEQEIIKGIETLNKIEEIDLGSLDTKELETQIQNSNTVKDSNTQNFSIENTNKDIVGKIAVNNDENRLFLSSEEEEAYKSYVEEENYRQNKFSLNDFNKKLQSLRSQKKYFQIGMDMQVDGSDAENPSGMKGFNKINDLSFKVETGYLDKFFVRYAFVMERPDRIYRRDPSRNSTFDFRRHEFESKYMFSKDPDKPWWIGGKLQYVQNGAPKASDPEIYESSWYAKKVNKITLGMATLSHSFENAEWEIGAGMKWDKPSNKKLG